MTSTYQLKEKPASDIQEDNSLQVFNGLVDFNTLDFINQGGKVVDTKYQIKSSAKRTTAYL